MEITVNIILFLAGLAIGNWLAVGRDKRKEFNQIADKVYLKLKKQKESVKKNSALVSGPEENDLETLKRRISVLKRKILRNLSNSIKRLNPAALGSKMTAANLFIKIPKK